MTLLARLGFAIATLALACGSSDVLACNVSTTSMAFGSIDPISHLPTDSSGTIIVSCPTDTMYTIVIDGGGGTVDNRRMTNGADVLNYQLYTDANLALVWGDGTSGTMAVSGTAEPGADAIHTVYGRVPPQPLAKVGAYADTLTVTINF